jgi:hypothetical protein
MGVNIWRSAKARGIVDCGDKSERVNCPTPEIVISRRQAVEAFVIRLLSALIASTAVITAVRADRHI